MDIAVSILASLGNADLREVASDPKVSTAVRAHAEQLVHASRGNPYHA